MIDNSLVGWQLIKLTDYELVVRHPSSREEKHFCFELDQGGCCGYAELTSALFISDEELGRNPIITKVDRDFDDDGDERLTITFFGEMKKLAAIDAAAGSGSGWCYGAAVSVSLVGTNEEEILVEW